MSWHYGRMNTVLGSLDESTSDALVDIAEVIMRLQQDKEALQERIGELEDRIAELEDRITELEEEAAE